MRDVHLGDLLWSQNLLRDREIMMCREISKKQ